MHIASVIRTLGPSPRRGRLLVPALGLAALAIGVGLARPGEVDHEHAGHEHHDDEGPGEHACGVDAQTLLSRFEEAKAGAQGATLDLADGGVAVRGELNVGVSPGVDVAALARRHGLSLVRALPALGVATLAGDAAACGRIAAEPGVLFAEPNFVTRTAGEQPDPFQELQLGWANARLAAAHELTTGRPDVLVAVLDTGCDLAHPDLAGRVVAGWDFVNGGPDPKDDNGHGTAVTGLIVSTRGNGFGISGVAPDARVLAIKVADSQGLASVAHVAAGIDLAISRGARVLNLSLGTRVASRALAVAIERARAAGLVVVAAAGNDPTHQAIYPAAYPGVLAVTSLGDRDELAFATSLASEVSLGAPGEKLVTTYPGGVHGYINGTSAAAAFASGVAALVWSREPALSADEVARALRCAQVPLPALAGLEHAHRFGRLDARLAVLRADRRLADLAVTRLETLPRRPLLDAPATVRVEVENRGNAPASTRVVVPGVGIAPVTLAPGERRTVELAWARASVGRLEAYVEAVPGETALDDDRRLLEVAIASTPEVDLRVVERALAPLEPGATSLGFSLTVENVGSAPAHGLEVDVRAGERALELAGERAVTLAAGARVTLSYRLALPRVASPTTVVVVATATAPGEVTPADATTRFDAILDGSAALGQLYQQSNDVDLILDAPWRIEPGRDAVPVLVFAASKGGLGIAGTRLRLDRTQMTVKDQATATSGTVVYDAVRGQAPVVAPGTAVVDEMGQPRTGAQALAPFGDVELGDNGRHDIVRLPRAAFGVALQPATADEHRFLDCRVDWTYRMPLFFGLAATRTGHHRSVLRLGFASEPWPRLPGEGVRHDVHVHTIAEWYFTSPLSVFAPRKAYGGPVQMIREAGYAMGATDSIADVRDKVIVTDHHNFYNMTTPDPTSADHWPPHGEQGLSHHAPGTTKLEAYRNIFGDAAGEEVAFKQALTTVVPVPGTSTSVPVTLPIGAHMLLMQGDHVEGAWNGGGWIAGPGNVGPDVDLRATLDRAGQGTGGTRAAFAYAAHPFSSNIKWSDPNLERELGLLPQLRTRDGTDRARQQFVLKGLQLWNSRAGRSLATAQIDFNDLNPWAVPSFARGSGGWDRGLQSSLVRWHEVLATDLEYAFTDAPETRFIRKVFVAAGSDSHGDFNFATSRLATPLAVAQTYHCNNERWFMPTTYCLGDGRPGPTPAQRALQAYADGATVMSDGPLVTFTLDADAHLDGRDLRWHSSSSVHEDDDGRIGGGGAYDGLGTALVRRGAADVTYRYRYTNSADFGSNAGQVVSIKLYKTEPGAPNPTRARGAIQQLVGRADLPATAEDQDLVRALDPAAEGPITKPTALSLGCFTGTDPDQQDLGVDEHRAYTNPIFAVPFDVQTTVARVDSATGTIPAGGLEVELTFDISMEPSTTTTVEVKPLDAAGDSTGRAVPAMTTLAPVWADRPGIRSSVLRLRNTAPIRLDGAAYPAPDRVSFVVVFSDPKDAFGNALNPIAFTFDAPKLAYTAPAPTASTASPATAGPGAPGGGGGGGGCALTPAATQPAPLALLALALLALLGRWSTLRARESYSTSQPS